MLSAGPAGDAPVCDVDLYDAAINTYPYAAYRAIRAQSTDGSHPPGGADTCE